MTENISLPFRESSTQFPTTQRRTLNEVAGRRLQAVPMDSSPTSGNLSLEMWNTVQVKLFEIDIGIAPTLQLNLLAGLWTY